MATSLKPCMKFSLIRRGRLGLPIVFFILLSQGFSGVHTSLCPVIHRIWPGFHRVAGVAFDAPSFLYPSSIWTVCNLHAALWFWPYPKYGIPYLLKNSLTGVPNHPINNRLVFHTIHSIRQCRRLDKSSRSFENSFDRDFMLRRTFVYLFLFHLNLEAVWRNSKPKKNRLLRELWSSLVFSLFILSPIFSIILSI